MAFSIIRNDITQVEADAIVNTANPKPYIGQGTDGAIYNAAGAEQLLAERKKIGNITPGQAVHTSAFALHARYIIHTVGPVWEDGWHGEENILRLCYRNSLQLAAQLNCKSVAFPLISSGIYGFPKGEALRIALSEIEQFLLAHEMEVSIVVLDAQALELSEKLISDIDCYIDEHSAQRVQYKEYRDIDVDDIRRQRIDNQHNNISTIRELPENISIEKGEELDQVINRVGNTFQQQLFRLIDESGMDDVTVYKRANLDRKLFSRIRNSKEYRPQKKTAISLAIALKLDMNAAQDLLSRAGYVLSASSQFDLIVSYFIEHRDYDIYKIDIALDKYTNSSLCR